MVDSAILYVTPTGEFKYSSSYSARKDFKFCKRKFLLTRVQGWREKRQGASLQLGIAVEEAVQYAAQNHGAGGPAKFLELWESVKLLPEFSKLEYTTIEDSWENCKRIGWEWLKIFELRFLYYPIQSPRFQVPVKKVVFPDAAKYANLVNTAYLDILCLVERDHPMLPPGDKRLTGLRPLIVDVKTASKPLTPALVRLDPQLVEYAWMTRIPDVAFLWFEKKGHGFKNGSRVTLLEPYGSLRAGLEVFVLDVQRSIGKGIEGVWIGSQKLLEAYTVATSNPDGTSLRGKVMEAAYKKFLDEHRIPFVPASILSKQRVQFAAARLTEQEINDMGRLVGQETVAMVMAHETGFYPMESGIRWPDDRCSLCSMLPICANDSESRDRLLTRVGEEWLDLTEEK